MERLLEGLTEAQASAVTSDGAPLVILAGAGSGKTGVLTRRIAWRVTTESADARHVLALTFTRKAAGELRHRLGQLGVPQGVAAGTFHSIAYAQLRRWWEDRDLPRLEVLPSKVRLVARVLGPRGGREQVRPMDVAAEIEWAKARMVDPSGYEAAALAANRRPPLPADAMARVYERYEDEKRKQRMVDFEDLLLLCVRTLQQEPAFADSQRWRFRHLFVDEFQDVNPTQAALLAGWRGPSDDLCVVGDPNQAIYSWNGAEPSFLTDFARREPGATVVRLDDNFRSSPQILAVASSVLAGGGVRNDLRAHRADGPLPSVRAFATDRDEARGIARLVRGRHRPGFGGAWSRIAVLARTNAQLVLIEEALRTAGIPCRVRGESFLQHPDVKDAVDDLRAAGGPLEPQVLRLVELVRSLPVADGPAAERVSLLEELVRLGRELLATEPNATVDWFVKWLHVSLSGGDGADADAVELATFHAAKGLEWPVVVLAGLERGLVPIGHAKTDAGVEEERRLLYVAVTRAEEELHCTWARERTFGTRSVPRQPSPWLDDIQAARAALSGDERLDLRDRITAERRKIRSIDGGRRGTVTVGANADPAVLSALKAWRSAAARAAGVPAYVIFHDTTLAAVAEAQPRTRASLLALPGLGPVKAQRYGDDLLRVVAEHAAAS
jgi:DNA helicase-2/ATP-dependent DNA helicase PcrA